MFDNACMPVKRSVDSGATGGKGATPVPSDDFLIAGMLGGDSAALNVLMGRYDRLVRYKIFRVSKDRCRRDPEWLESVASATWVGFVQSMRRDPQRRPSSLRAYLAQVARNQAISALRHAAPDDDALSISDDEAGLSITAELEEPAEALSRLELLESLRTCLSELDSEDGRIATQMEAITERRWIDAADALGLKESTLRSKWKRILGRLGVCVRKRTGVDSFAPADSTGDY